MTRVAAVVIGRNEGSRLARCLQSVRGRFEPVVYVDSASSDGSPEVARTLGAEVVALDMSIPFTFARARNAGAARALSLAPDLAYVQFVDADSEIVAAWPTRAISALDAVPTVGAVHGRVRERHPGATLYDRLFDLEFDPRIDDEDSMGGMALVRVATYLAVGGYAEHLRTFEDHELSFRLRRAGWLCERVDTDMALHEGGMTRWPEWWTRERRTGHGRAQLIALHGWHAAAPEWRRAVASIGFWGAGIPALALAGAWWWGDGALCVLAAYGVLLIRIFRRLRRRGLTAPDALLYAAARVIAKFPQLHGVLTFLGQRRTAA